MSERAARRAANAAQIAFLNPQLLVPLRRGRPLGVRGELHDVAVTLVGDRFRVQEQRTGDLLPWQLK